MPPLLNFLAALALVAILHLGAFAVAADALKITVRRVVIGWGPALCTLGRWTFKALPFGGVVRLRDTREEPDLDISSVHPTDAINLRSRAVQAAVPLAGPLALVLLAIAIRGPEGVLSVGAGFCQILRGAFDHDYAHMLLGRLSLAAHDGLLPLLAVIAAKVAAFNLLPLPVLNGGQALVSLLLGATSISPAWLQRTQILSTWVVIFLVLLWVAAIASYV